MDQLLVAEWINNWWPGTPSDVYSQKMHTVSSRESAGELRDALLRDLSTRSSKEVIVALEIIDERFPGDRQIEELLLNANRGVRKDCWTPRTPQELVRLIL